jgi:lysophospholipase L1-like esterase
VAAAVTLRVCVVGDSFVAGVGDPVGAGWVGRLAGRTGVTAYPLGIRRDTSTDVRDRWEPECTARFPAGSEPRLVIAFGANDATVEDGRRRVAAAVSRANLRHLLAAAHGYGWPTLVVGPPPLADAAHTERIGALDRDLAGVCAAVGVTYVAIFDALVAAPVWRQEVRDGDGAHPSADGYALLADLVEPAWRALLGL